MLDVVTQRLQELYNGRLATLGERGEWRAAETYGSGTECDSRHDVGAGSNTTIHNDIDVGTHAIDDR